MVLDELNNGKFFIQEGIIYTLTPLTKIEKIEQEIKKEIEAKVVKNTGKEAVLKILGSGIEYLTENGWKVTFLEENKENGMVKLLIAAPFKGGVMTGKNGDNENYKLYIPKGYLGVVMIIRNFPRIDNWNITILPNISGIGINETYKKYKNGYEDLHPHFMDDGTLCNGIRTEINKFDLDSIVALIEACINGSKRANGTSIWSYNKDSPATEIEDCDSGLLAYELHKKGKTDDQIWKEIR